MATSNTRTNSQRASDEQLDGNLKIRCEPELLEAIKEIAKAQHVKSSVYVRKVLWKAIGEEESMQNNDSGKRLDPANCVKNIKASDLGNDPEFYKKYQIGDPVDSVIGNSRELKSRGYVGLYLNTNEGNSPKKRNPSN